MANEQGVSHIWNHVVFRPRELLCFCALPLRVVRVYLLRYNFGEGDNPVFNA